MYSFLLSQERRLDSCFRRSDSFSDFYESLIPDFAQKTGSGQADKKITLDCPSVLLLRRLPASL